MSQILRCYCVGSESLLIHCTNTLLEKGHRLLGVVTAAEPIVQWARQHAVPVIPPGPGLAERLDQPFDYLYSITNLSVLPDDVLSLPARGTVNFHDGPLPRYAGLHATAWALINGEAAHGITWHLISGGIDEGDILLQHTFPISPGETSFSLNTKCYEAAITTFPDVVDRLARDEARSTPQDLSGRSYFGKFDRPPAAGVLSWEQPADQIVALVRALDFGPVDNPLCRAKIWLGDEACVVSAAQVEPGHSGQPGVVLESNAERLLVGTGSGAVAITGIQALDGSDLPLSTIARRFESTGRVPSLDAASAARLTTTYVDVSRSEAFWVRRIPGSDALQVPGGTPVEEKSSVRVEQVEVELSPQATALGPDFFVAGTAAYLARLCQRRAFSLGYRHGGIAKSTAGFEAVLAPWVPLDMDVAAGEPFERLAERLTTQLAGVRARGTFARDVFARYPRLRGLTDTLPVSLDVSGAADRPLAAGATVIAFDARHGRLRWRFDGASFETATVQSLAQSCAGFLAAAAADARRPVQFLPLLTETQRRDLDRLNETAREIEEPVTLADLFERQAAQTPGAVAVTAGADTLTFAELNEQSNRLANYLRAEGVGSESLVGLALDRSVNLVVAILGILKAGGAYVPLDPTYPRERIALMLDDAAAPLVVTTTDVADRLGLTAPRLVQLDAEAAAIASASPASLRVARPEHLAYTLYTSGSTGRPKGVMVEHRNVVNFFAGMDDCLGTTPGVWVSVTSLSFDISVLEILWSLCRGFHLVLHTDRAVAAGAAPARPSRPLTFSLMFFASGEGRDETALDKYRLLIEAAKFGDAHGFSAVWTPERHFYAFGGLYPNPSVVSGALATITRHIHIRAGSVVSPLHQPIRIAEEWSLVDNLSNGRVGISFAAGWQPVDFVLRPETFADRKAQMFRDIDLVRRLWRGESINVVSPLGKEVAIRTLPRPIQKELPVWVTAAGNPETFEEAARAGAGVLTHLLGQTIEEVAEKVALYRRTWRAAGYDGQGTITLMLHTFVGKDPDHVRETVRQPMKDYLRSAVGLIKAAAWTFPTFKQKADATGKTPAEIFESQDLSPEEMDALLEYAFSRYYETSGLFGTPESCLALVERLREIGVDDIACLLDYGIPSATVLEHLPLLNEVRQRASVVPAQTMEPAARPELLGEQITAHRATHVQCTPSQLSLILATPEDRDALRQLSTICVGGEAFPPALAAELRSVTDARIWNMYGPTETTIWSSTYPVSGTEVRMPIGAPIANTQLYVLDEHRQPLPPGAVGELYIGGAGVARGYYRRPELTAERFVPDLFSPKSGGRLYRTGDLARRRPDGTLDFLGRADFQVKLRGYRIELGEIEAALSAQAGVRDAVVIAREDSPGDKRLVGYVVLAPAATFDQAAAHDALTRLLPEFMVPSAIVVLEALPLTPNGKVNRAALPAPERTERRRKVPFVSPENELEQVIASVWRDLLGLDDIGRDDNFFDLGGHSLLTVQAHRRLQQVTARPLVLTDLFRFTTVRALATHLGGSEAAPAGEHSQQRAHQRRAGLAERQRRREAGRG